MTTHAAIRGHTETRRAAIVFAVAVVTLAAAYGSQYIGGLAPCELCLYQRWPWWAAIALLAVSFIPAIGSAGRGGLVALAGVGLIAGAGIAFYHVGVEQHWWAGPAACSVGQQAASFAELQKMMNQPVPRCDEVAWSMLGISMAGYNGLLSLATGVFAVQTGLLGLRRRSKESAHG